MKLLRLMALFVLATTAMACDREPDALPTPEPGEFASGLFNDVPRYPRSEPVGPRSEMHGTVAQSFKATGAAPDMVLGWYNANLPGWTVTEPPSQIGVGTWRGRWARDDHFLLVSATRGPTLPEDEPQVVTQYSLSLEPRP